MQTLQCRHSLPSHQEKVSELSAQKEALNEKLKAEEERRKHILSDKNLVITATSITTAFRHRHSQLRQNTQTSEIVLMQLKLIKEY